MVLEKIKSELNEKQQSAVIATEGRVRIVAGAGSGKTRVLAYRYAYLVDEYKISPSNILCLTFTNKAAQEMRKRIVGLVPNYPPSDFICTIHGFCVKFLRQEIHRLGWPSNFQIIDKEDSKAYAKQAMKELGLEKTAATVRQALDSIAQKKSSDQDYVNKYMASSDNVSEEGTKKLFVHFLLLQKKYYALDFSDLIYFTITIMKAFPEVTEKWSQRFNYIQVDEVQDCNDNDWTIVEMLASVNKNLFVVGDPDQAIYEWRGAKPTTFVKFKPDTDIILNENYRSTTSILDAANSIISNNVNRVPKDLVTKNEEGSFITHIHCKNEEEEGNLVCEQIKRLTEFCPLSHVAVLYRTSSISRFIEQALIRGSIKYTIWGGMRFFERKEVKDCLAYLQLVASNDDMAFKRVINTPARKFGKVSLQKLEEIAAKEETDLFTTLVCHDNEKEFNKITIKEFISLIKETRENLKKKTISETATFLMEKTGLKAMYSSDQDRERIDNLNEFINSIKLYEKTNENEDIDIFKYLQDISLYTNMDYKDDKDTVKLMTIHQAKGLEFPFVFIVGVNEGVFPSFRSIREKGKSALEEERRLMYVAITRAEKQCYITESEGFSYQSGTGKCPSRFLLEIPKTKKNVIGKISSDLWGETYSMISATNKISIDDDTDETYYEIGDTVNHKFFGRGKIISYNRGNNTYTVKFNCGIRNITL